MQLPWRQCARLSTLKARRKATVGDGRRGVATSGQENTNKLRNMALMAHIDSGKTTLTESILLKSSYLSSAGSVDTGSTTTDFLPAERERGITIQSASVPVRWKDWTFNLIDTPGHADFGMEVESASRVVDGAVVLIDSVEGVEAQTKGVWRQLDRYGVKARMMFLNKLDRAGASVHSSLMSILAHRLHPRPVMLTLPVASFDTQDYLQGEPGIQGVVDLVNWNIHKWDEKGKSTKHSLPTDVEELSSGTLLPSDHPLLPHLLPARTSLLENVSMCSEDFMETLLDLPSSPSAYLTVQPSTIIPHLRAATIRSDLLPVLCGSAFKHIGTELVMDYVGALFPSPLDVDASPPKPTDPLRMLAWKVWWDERKGWMTFVRVYSGTLTRQSVLYNTSSHEKERVSKLLLLYGSDAKEVDSLPFGSVGVLVGLRYTRTGDTLVANQQAAKAQCMRDIVPPPPVMTASVLPRSHADLQPVEAALQALVRTDPSVRVETNEGQILAHGLGALHLEIVEGRLRDEWNVNFEFGARRVSYREGFGSAVVSPVPTSWLMEHGGKQIEATVELSIRPLEPDEQGDPVWNGNLIVNKDDQPLVLSESAPTQHDAWGHIARGISTALSSSPHTSLVMTHLHVKVHSFDHPRDAPPVVLAGATARILRDWLRKAGMGPIFEPYIKLKVNVYEDSMGKIVKDITEHGGEILDLASGSMDLEGDDEVGGYPSDALFVPPESLSPSSMASSDHTTALRRSIHAIAPLSRMLDFSNRLRALSGGHGVFEMENAGFRPVAEDRRLEILKEIGRA
ncbi:Ribosome-releasing factor 2, mitochondrial [Steccherinum ochraceum]|uniref:Ribosome-releasing factor 2, mitochondrial n=1 Tax=Steccherinum ochraceum TaxID=92696 RepID=A0A4R0RRX0_9APHY|nr:Ribosome-releasing factor 2, mitochondrial [Steccherinum ochraceum]